MAVSRRDTRSNKRSRLADAPSSSGIQTQRKSRRWTQLSVAIIVAAVVAAFYNCVSGAMVFDDRFWILGNRSIQHLWPIRDVLFPRDARIVGGRPVVSLTLALNYAFGGSDPYGYHVVNLCVHALAALALFGIVRRTLMLPALRDRFGEVATPLALVVALVWAVHPLQTAAVTYIIQRTEALVGLFYFLTLYCVIRAAAAAKTMPWYVAAVSSCILGMATKEVMATAPLVVLVYDRTFLSGSFGNAIRNRFGLYFSMGMSWIVVAWVLITTDFHAGSTGYGVEGFTWVSYLLTQPGVLLHYLSLTFWPTGLSLDYWWPPSTAPGEIVPAATVVCALFGLTAWALIKHPAFGFVGAWFFVILAPTSSVVPLKEAAFDHRMYLPLAALAVLTIIGGYLLWQRLNLPSESAKASSGIIVRSLPWIFAGAVIVGLGCATHLRNSIYQSELGIWRDTVEKCPNNPRAHNNFATALGPGHPEEAIAHFEKALELKPNYEEAHSNLADVLNSTGRFAEAVTHCEKALEIDPNYSSAYNNLGNALIGLRRFDEAIASYNKALKIKPGLAKAQYNLALALSKRGRDAEAIEHYAEAIAIEPRYAKAHNNLASLLAQQGKVDEAEMHFQKAIELDPNYVDAHYNLGMIFYSQGRGVKAASQWRAAVRLKPDTPTYIHSLVWLLASKRSTIRVLTSGLA